MIVRLNLVRLASGSQSLSKIISLILALGQGQIWGTICGYYTKLEMVPSNVLIPQCQDEVAAGHQAPQDVHQGDGLGQEAQGPRHGQLGQVRLHLQSLQQTGDIPDGSHRIFSDEGQYCQCRLQKG